MRKHSISKKKATAQLPDQALTDFSNPPFEIQDNPAACRVWDRYQEHFQKLGLRRVDEGVLSLFCSEFSRYWILTKVLLENGQTYQAPNGFICVRPEVKMAKDSFANSVRLASKIGLTLIDRQKLETVQPDEEKTPAQLVVERLRAMK